MATTKARKLRRLELRTQRDLIEKFLQAYLDNPGNALKVCFEKFGKDKFEGMLQQYLVRHSIKSALSLTLSQCLGGKL